MTAVRYRIPDALAAMPAADHHVVEASAGTGKTYLIEHRVLQLVAAGARIDSILVVTFTEKATAELRLRIRKLLSRAHTCREHDAGVHDAHILITDEVRRRLQDALVAADTAPIFTIHALCRRVLTENAFSSRRLFEQTHVAAETAFSGAFRGALREVFATDASYLPYLRAYLSTGKSVDDLETLLFRAAQQPGELRPRFDADALAAAAADALAAAGDAGAGEGIAATCRQQRVHAATCRSIGKKIDALCALLAPIAGSALAIAAAIDAGSRKDLAYLIDKIPVDRGDALARVSAALSHLAAALCPIEAAVAQALLPAVRDRLRRDKARRGELDFGDLLTLVWESLDGDGGDALADRLRRRYHHALIDEFQDTDPIQWAIFRRLYLQTAGPGSLAIIGDPKQAIYGFRGADVATYLQACDEVQEAGGRLIRLPANYRSTPAVVRAYNDLVTDDGGGPFFSGGIRYDEPVTAARGLRATRDGGEVAPVRVFRLTEGERKADARSVRAALGRRIAQEIRALLGDRPLWLEEGEARRRVGAGDIFVLTRSRGESDEIAHTLRRAGVPCALYQQAGLFASPEAMEVFELLLGIAEPERQSARFRAWQTRFFDVPLGELPALAAIRDTDPLVTTLRDWRSLAAAYRYDELFSAILADSGVLERELFADSSERGLTNFLHIFEILLAEVNRSRCSIEELACRLNRWRIEAESEAAADTDLQRLESEASAVQIMTVHKSKGLEAGVVFVYGACGEPRGGTVHVYREGDRRVVFVGPPDADVADAVRAESAAEDQRLLYVAITRAAARLYLPLYPTSRGTYAQLNARLGRVAAAPELAADFEIEDVVVDDGRDPVAAQRPSDPLAGWRPPPRLLGVPEVEPALVDPSRRGFVMTSYTHLKRAGSSPAPDDGIGVEHGGRGAAVELSPDELSPGAASGIFLHELLEQVDVGAVVEEPDFETWRARGDVRDLFDRAMARHGRDERQRRHSESMVYRAFTTPLRALEMPSLAARERDQRELEFLYPLPGRRERGFVKGFIDFVFVWRGRTYVLDWKSDVLADYGATAVAAHAEASYALQARLYALALIKMLGITGERDHERRFGGVVYWYLRGADADGSGVYAARPSYDELCASEAELEAMEIA